MSYETKIKERLESYNSIKQFHEYTDINNAEFAPEICNEFVTIYMDE